MKIFVRITAVLISVLLCLGSSVFALEDDTAQAEAEAVSPSTKNSKAAELLFNLGLLSRDGFAPQEEVKRGAFVSAAIKIKGQIGHPPVDTTFSDVKADRVDSGAIKAAVDMGVLSGYGDNTFRPDNQLTKEQGIKIIVSVLGYDVYAQANGGYPGGYLTVAAMLGLLKKVAISDGESFAWDDAATIIYNALHTDVLQEKVGSDDFFSVDGENPLTLWLGMSTTEGIVNANEDTSVTSLNGITKGYVKIGDELFLENGTDTSAYIAYPVKAYYKISDTGAKLLLSVEAKKTVKELTVVSDDIAPKTTTNSLVYYQNEKSSTANYPIDNNAVIFYNGKFYSRDGLTDAFLKPNTGSVTLADVNGDNKADVVKIKESIVYVVKDISYQSYTITDLYNQPALRLDIDNSNSKVNIIKDGESIAFSEIVKNNVLTVAVSKDGLLVNIEVSADKRRGIVEEKSDDYLTIDGERYQILEANKDEIGHVPMGNITVFYFTVDGMLAAYDTSVNAREQYGFLLAAKTLTKGIVAKNAISIRVFTKNDKFENFDSSEKLKINGKAVETGEEAIAALKDGNVVHRRKIYQLIKFELDADGKLVAVNTAADNRRSENEGTKNGTGEFIEDFSVDYRTTDPTANAGMTSYKDFGLLAMKYTIGNTMSISLPNINNFTDYDNGLISMAAFEKMFKMFIPSSTWVDDQNSPAKGDGLLVEIYDVDKNFNCGVITSYAKPLGGVSSGVQVAVPEYDYFLVDKIADAIDDEGYTGRRLYGMYQGKYQSLQIDVYGDAFADAKGKKLLNLRRGDVVRIGLNSLNVITNIIKVFTLHPELDAGYDNSEISQQYVTWETRSNEYLLNGNYYNEFNNNAGGTNPSSNPAWEDTNPNSFVFRWLNTLRMVHAKVDNIIGSFLYFNLKMPDGTVQPTRSLGIISSTRIYVYDEASDTVRLGSISDIDPANEKQTVVIRIRALKAHELVVVNREALPANEIYWVGEDDGVSIK